MKATNVGMGFVLWTLLYFPLAVWNGFVISKLWAWFVVPPLNAPALPWLYAVGISLIVCAWIPYSLLYPDRDNNELPRGDYLRRVLTRAVMYVVADSWLLGLGFVWSLMR